MTTQAMLLDEDDNCEFYAYQLNTIAIMQAWDENQRPKNFLWRSGPKNLFEKNQRGEIEKINADVVKIFLKFLHNIPTTATAEENLRPFLRPMTAEKSKSSEIHAEKLIEQQQTEHQRDRVSVSN